MWGPSILFRDYLGGVEPCGAKLIEVSPLLFSLEIISTVSWNSRCSVITSPSILFRDYHKSPYSMHETTLMKPITPSILFRDYPRRYFIYLLISFSSRGFVYHRNVYAHGHARHVLIPTISTAQAIHVSAITFNLT